MQDTDKPKADKPVPEDADATRVAPEDAGLGKEAIQASLAKLRPRYNQMLKNLAN